jgi:general secretion pathway protein A
MASLNARQYCVLLLGEAGVGKTCLLHAALAHRDLQHLKTVQVFHPQLVWHDICQLLCPAVGLEEGTEDTPEMIEALYRALLTEHDRGQQVVLVLDEADAIPLAVLAKLVHLSHCRALTGAPLLQLVLAGLPGLWRQFRSLPLHLITPLRVTRVRLAPLTYGESLAYIRHRLQHAGADAGADTVFAAAAVRVVARRAGGNPRVLNELGTQLLIRGFLARQRPISARLAQDVLTAYGAQGSFLRWWGVTAAASLLVVGVLVGLFSSTAQHVAERGPHGLVPLTRHLLPAASEEPTGQPAAPRASPAGPALRAPRQPQPEPALAEPTPGRVVRPDPGAGDIRLVPRESLKSQRVETPSATSVGRAGKSCEELKTEIQAKLDAKGITGYALTIIASGDVQGHQIVGSCEGNTKKIAYTRLRQAP